MVSPIFAALDFPDLASAMSIATAVREEVGGFKVGLELIWNEGPTAVEAVVALDRPVFVDAKLHDIPNTVFGAARAIGKLAPRFVTVHASGGTDVVEAAVAGLAETSPEAGVLAVTVLTSHSQHDFSSAGFRGTISEGVGALVEVATAGGAEGVVCAVSEVATVKMAAPKMLAVTPGIRMAGDVGGDQERIETPSGAVAAGADILVVGRPITRSPDPARAARMMADSIRNDL